MAEAENKAQRLTPEQRKYARELAEAVALKWLSRPLGEQDIHLGLMWVLAAIEKFGDYVLTAPQDQRSKAPGADK